MKGFNSLEDEVHDLYARGEHDRALALVQQNLERFPERRATLVYWDACFRSLQGDADEALQRLKAGLAEGLWWAGATLRDDPDLEAVRDRPGSDELIAVSNARWRDALAGSSLEPVVLSPDRPRAALVVLQGGSTEVGDVAQQWRPAVDLGCSLVVPGCGQPTSSDGVPTNWIDEGLTDTAVLAAVRAAESTLPLLIAGYSAGGRQALRIGLTGAPVVPVGLLLFAPGSLRREIDPGPAIERGLRVWCFVGDDDWLFQEVLATNDALRRAGLEVVERRAAGVAHVVPDDLAPLLSDALEFLL